LAADPSVATQTTSALETPDHGRAALTALASVAAPGALAARAV
jgi:hypothetical protein